MSPAALAQHLVDRADEIAQQRIVTGFDGFVDERLTVVAEREGIDRWQPMASLTELGGWIAGCAGRNGLREVVMAGAEPGGCSVNLADGLVALGVGVELFATLGSPRHPAFDGIAGRVRRCTSWGTSHGRTLAIECADGKAMLSAVAQLGEFDAAALERHLADGVYASACASAALIALTNWSLYPRMTACWELLAERVFAVLPERPRLFIDLVDPASRSVAEIDGMLLVLRRLQAVGEVTLSVNLNEGARLAKHLHLPWLVTAADRELGATATAVRQALGIQALVVHNARWNAYADERLTLATPAGPFCAEPVKTTGAGDRFNAGYGLAWALGLSPGARLLLGCAVAGVFIRLGRSPTLAQVAEFLRQW